tara:strand:- start:413 stop:619 length:207 start_codon:yes stop_codon:yes gene_type:complete
MLKKIGFISAGLCGISGLLTFYNAINNLLSMLRIGDLANIYWFFMGVIGALTWIMLAVFVGMLANKLK